MKRIFVIGLSGFCFCSHVLAQNDVQGKYDDFKKKANIEYEDFRQKANQEYVGFMKKSWTLYQEKPGIANPQSKEPTLPPVVFKNKEKPLQDKLIPYDAVVPLSLPKRDSPKPIAPIRKAESQNEITKYFTFYGMKCEVHFSGNETFSLPDIKEETVADAWEKLSQVSYNNLIRDCLETKIRLNLCDWAYLQYLDCMVETCLGKGNEATLLKAYVYCQSGYKIRLGYNDGHLCMLIASMDLIYKKPYFNVKGDMFYPIGNSTSELRIYDRAYPGEQDLSLNVGKEQYFAMGKAIHTLASKGYPEVKSTVQSNTNLIDFFNTYPQSCINNDPTTKWQFYANTPLSASVRSTLYPTLSKVIEGRSRAEAANILLNFVQTAFVYKTDEEVWGADRPFFSDETIYYPYSDCEDRAILFSRLVRDLMNRDVVLVYYPGHLATAVCFDENLAGDYLQVNGKRYLVCDPTYINAPIGMTMPGMDNQKAKVIFLQ
jgi:hypothetical protein